MSTNVPSATLGDTGVILPSENDLVSGLWADFQTAFGAGLNESPATPQGQLVAALAAMQGAANDLFAQYVNQVDPAFASGRMQDAIGRIYFLSRLGPQSTVVSATCTGSAGTIIPAGSLAQAADGEIYQSLGQATIPETGSVNVQFAAINTGPISCPEGTLTTIYRIVPGWDSINNAADGVVGRDAESRAAFEARRLQSVALNAVGILPSIRAALLQVSGVIDAYVTENPTASSATIGGKSIGARSLYVAVQGGADADVARAIWRKKPPGCGYTGNTTVTVKDTSSGYEVPYPSYDVTFQRPAALPIHFAVTLANNGLVPSDATAQIRQTMAAVFAGQGPDGRRERIGATIFALRYVTAIQSLGEWAQVISIAVGTTSSPTATEQTVNIDQAPTLDPADIAVVLA